MKKKGVTVASWRTPITIRFFKGLSTLATFLSMSHNLQLMSRRTKHSKTLTLFRITMKVPLEKVVAFSAIKKRRLRKSRLIIILKENHH